MLAAITPLVQEQEALWAPARQDEEGGERSDSGVTGESPDPPVVDVADEELEPSSGGCTEEVEEVSIRRHLAAPAHNDGDAVLAVEETAPRKSLSSEGGAADETVEDGDEYVFNGAVVLDQGEKQDAEAAENGAPAGEAQEAQAEESPRVQKLLEEFRVKLEERASTPRASPKHEAAEFEEDVREEERREEEEHHHVVVADEEQEKFLKGAPATSEEVASCEGFFVGEEEDADVVTGGNEEAPATPLDVEGGPQTTLVADNKCSEQQGNPNSKLPVQEEEGLHLDVNDQVEESDSSRSATVGLTVQCPHQEAPTSSATSAPETAPEIPDPRPVEDTASQLSRSPHEEEVVPSTTTTSSEIDVPTSTSTSAQQIPAPVQDPEKTIVSESSNHEKDGISDAQKFEFAFVPPPLTSIDLVTGGRWGGCAAAGRDQLLVEAHLGAVASSEAASTVDSAHASKEVAHGRLLAANDETSHQLFVDHTCGGARETPLQEEPPKVVEITYQQQEVGQGGIGEVEVQHINHYKPESNMFGGGNANGGGGGLFGSGSSFGGGGLFGGSNPSPAPAAGGLFGGALLGGGSSAAAGAANDPQTGAPTPSTSTSNEQQTGGAAHLPQNSTFTSVAARDAFIANAQATANAERTRQIETVDSEEVTHISGWSGPKVTLQVKQTLPQHSVQWLYKGRSKLFRFKDSEWKERAIGELKIRFDEDVGEFLVSINQDKTGKCKACFPIQNKENVCVLKYQDANSKKTVMFTCSDSSDEDDMGAQLFALKFGSEEKCQAFMTVFNSLREFRKVPDDWELPGADGGGSGAAAAGAAPTAPTPTPPATNPGNGGGAASSNNEGKEPAPAAAAESSSATTKPANAEQPKTFGLFGAPASSGSPAAGPSTTGLFGAPAAEKPIGSGSGLFGSAAGTGLFGAPTAPASTGLFGAPAAAASSSPKEGGSAPPLHQTTGLFGGGSAAPTGLFGGPPAAEQKAGLFGVAPAGTTAPTTANGGTTASTGTTTTAATSTTAASSAAGQLPEGTIFKSSTERDNFIKNAQATATAERTRKIETVDDQEVWDDRWGDGKATLQVKTDRQSTPDNTIEVYRHRAKLFRFRDGEWKERGLGDAQLLRALDIAEGGDESTSFGAVTAATSRVQFILRQEKTGKIQANFALPGLGTDYCNLEENQGNNKTWCFTAYDCSEDEPAAVKLALKFRDRDIAEAFRDAWENARATMVGPVSVDEAKSLLAEAKEKSHRTGAGGEKEKSNASSSQPAAAGAGEKAASPSSQPKKAEEAKPSLFGSAAPAANGGSSTSLFGGAASSTGGLFGGGASTGGGLFGGGGGSAASNAGSAGAGTNASSLFGGGGAGGLFGGNTSLFGGGEASPVKSFSKTVEKKTTVSPEKQEGKTEEELEREEAEREVWSGSYDVKVSLEEKRTISTGFEGEDTIHLSRGKIYRLRDGGMRERGLGEVRLLRNRDSKQVRCVLRQEKTNKIRANFVLTSTGGLCQLTRTPSPDTEAFEPNVWYLTVFDCSDEELGAGATERIAVKHKTGEMSDEFAQVFRQALLESDGKASPGVSLPVVGSPQSKPAEKKRTLVGAYKTVSGQPAGTIDANNCLSYDGYPGSYPLEEIAKGCRYRITDEEDQQWDFDANLEGGTLTWDHGDFWIKDIGSTPDDQEDSSKLETPKEFQIFTPPLPGVGAAAGAAAAAASSSGAGPTVSAGNPLKPFKPQDAGKWSCAVCKCKWPQDQIQCGACESYKPGVDVEKIEKEKAEKKAAVLAKFGGGGGSSGGDNSTTTSGSGGGGTGFFTSSTSGGFNTGGGAPGESSRLTGTSTSALGAAAASAAVFGGGAASGASAAPAGGFSFGTTSTATTTGGGSLFGGGTTTTTAGTSPAASPSTGVFVPPARSAEGGAAVVAAPGASSAELKKIEREVKDSVDQQKIFRKSVSDQLDEMRQQLAELSVSAASGSGHGAATLAVEEQVREANRKVEALSLKVRTSEESAKKQFTYMMEKMETIATNQETFAVQFESRMADLERAMSNQVTDKVQSLRAKLSAEMNSLKQSASFASAGLSNTGAAGMAQNPMESDRVYELLNNQQETLLEQMHRNAEELKQFVQVAAGAMEKKCEKLVETQAEKQRIEVEQKFDKVRTQQAYNPAGSSFSSRLSNLRAQRGVSVGTPETVTVFGSKAMHGGGGMGRGGASPGIGGGRAGAGGGVFTPTQTPNRTESQQ